MHITIINDCHDDNAAGRQMARAASLMNASVSMVGVGEYGDLSAAGNLIDVLDGYGEKEGVVLVNVAPRHKGSKKWPNGTPFCHFTVKNVLVVASFDGLTLSLIKKFGLSDSVSLMDIPEATSVMVGAGAITEAERERIINSQFRSFDFVPRIAAFLHQGGHVPAETIAINEILSAPLSAWWIDNFGNIKTTLLKEDVDFEDRKQVATVWGELMCTTRLADVPKGEVALTVGSSGYKNKRFLEIVVQGERASERLNVNIGDVIIDK